MNYNEIVSKMSLEDKVTFCSGEDFWTTKAFEKYGIPKISLNDGPHGIRKQNDASDHMGINESVKATCFPTASATSCSWDRRLLKEMGEALGQEALQEQISVILGPGVNIKRNPLCGRNFEYFSEDPFLSGELAKSWINGVQSQGIGVSIKHFACNNQENERMSSDSIIDERTLREIYLRGFEIAIKEAKPATVMCAYNKINGTYCSDHEDLLQDILRDEWGFDGVVMTDWGAMNDRVNSLKAGLELEMPSSKGYFDKSVIAAIKSGDLKEEMLNECVNRLLKLVFTSEQACKKDYHYSVSEHHNLARKIAAHSGVLLKNDDNLLPLNKNKKIALIGALAKEPRYQGAGSSRINPHILTNAIDGFDEQNLSYHYYPGYSLETEICDSLIQEAVYGAKAHEIAVVFAGLPAAYESEGFDRSTLSMPESHNKLISSVAKNNHNTVVVLVGGAPVVMPWLNEVKAVIHMSLSGQAGGLAVVDLLTGRVNPSGKLAESYPLCYEDVPSAGFYEVGKKQAQYREGIYVGYRYYDKANKEVLFPFGFGLSYTSFEYTNIKVSHKRLIPLDELTVSLTVKNTGNFDGEEIVQLYVKDIAQYVIFRPEKELKGFEKVDLRIGEEKQIEFKLDSRAFAFYHTESCSWQVIAGEYTICIGSSSRDLRLQEKVTIQTTSVGLRYKDSAHWYYNLSGKVKQEDFEALLGKKIEPVISPVKGAYRLSCSLNDMKKSFVIKMMIWFMEKSIGKTYGGVDYNNPTFKMLMETSLNTPIKNLCQLSPASMPPHIGLGLVHMANGKFIKGVVVMIKKSK